MRLAISITLTLLAVTLAGCSDEPPAGEFSSTGHALATAGHVHSAMYQSYESPLADSPAGGATAATGECPFDTQPAEGDPVYGTYRCTHAESMLNYMITALDDAGAGQWTMGFYTEETGPDASVSTPVTATEMGGYWNYTNADENIAETANKVGLYITASGTTYLFASSGIQGTSDALVIQPEFTAISYTASYKGKDLTVTVNGLDAEAPLPITGWIVNVDETGAKTHAVEVPLVGGENVFTADGTIDKHQQFHIHLKGTNLNLATGTIE